MQDTVEYFLDIYIKEIKEIQKKSIVLKELINSLYDGVGKETIENNAGIIAQTLERLITEGRIIQDMIKDLIQKRAEK